MPLAPSAGGGLRPALGVSWEGRPAALLPTLAARADVIEVVPDALRGPDGEVNRTLLDELDREAPDVPLTYHGIGLSIGSVDAWNDDYLRLLDQVLAWREPLWHSEHLGFTHVDGAFLGTMPALPTTQESLELVIEPIGDDSAICELLTRLDAGARVRRTLRLTDGHVLLAALDAAHDADIVQLQGDLLVTTHGPHWRLLVIGAGQMTRYLAEMAAALDYQVTVCDPRAEYAAEFAVGATRLVRSMPDDAVIDFLPDAHTAVIALTHDPKLDDLALLEALRSNAFYVGAIGSRANQAKRRERLATHFDMTPEELDRLHGPVGLKNGARTPPEIAVAILAELTAARYGYRIPEPVRMQPGHATGGSLSRSLSSVIG